MNEQEKRTDTDSDLIAVSEHRVIDITNDAVSPSLDDPKTRKTMKKADKKRKFKVKSEKQVQIERFAARVLMIFALFIAASAAAFFLKPLTDGIIFRLIGGEGGFNRTILTVRYGVVWLIILAILYYPMYQLGYREARKKQRVDYRRTILLFLAAEFLYISFSLLLLLPIRVTHPTSVFFGLFMIPYSYLSSLLTEKTTLFDLARGYFGVNLLSIGVTFQFTAVPSLILFLAGYKARLRDREKAKKGLGKKKNTFVIENSRTELRSGRQKDKRSF